MTKEHKILGAETRAFLAPVTVERRAVDGKEVPVIVGYALKFNTLSKPLSWGFREEIMPGALDNCDLSDVVCRFNHSDDFVLGRTTSGTLRLTVDAVGLRYECDVPDTTAGRDLLVLIERGDISQSSFEFICRLDSWSMDQETGAEIRSILSFLKISDVAPVVRPAYIDTEVAKRSLEASKVEQHTDTTYEVELAKLELDI